jgi:hypothetical protein
MRTGAQLPPVLACASIPGSPPEVAVEFRALDQYRAMMRSYERLKTLATDHGPVGDFGYAATDIAKEFCSNLFHLKDWLKKEHGVDPGEVEAHVKSSRALSIAGDICNSLKHAGLDRPPRAGAPLVQINTALTSTMPLAVPPGTEIGKLVSNRNPSDGDTLTLNRWTGTRTVARADVVITIGAEKHNGLNLARQCVADWDGFLEQRGIRFPLAE